MEIEMNLMDRLMAEPYLLEEIVKVAAFFFCRPADFRLSFSGVESSSLVFQSLNLFRGGNIHVIFNSVCVLYPVVEQFSHLNHPFSFLGPDLILITYYHWSRRFGGYATKFNLSFVTRLGGLRSGFEDPDRPEVFIEP
jgi:hypothetical protein